MRRTRGWLRFLFHFFPRLFDVGTSSEREEGERDDRRKKNLLVKVEPVRRREGVVQAG